MDRNSVIGFALLLALVVGYVAYNYNTKSQYEKKQQQDSIAYAKAHPKPVVDSSKAVVQMSAADSAANDSLRRTMPPAYFGQAQSIKLENKKLSLEFSTKGAYPVSAQVKAYKTYDQLPLYLFKGDGNRLNMILPGGNGSLATADLFFTPVQKSEPNGDQSVDFTADLGSGKKVDILYTLPADDYMMRCQVSLAGMPGNTLQMAWETQMLHTEKDIATERTGTQVYYHYKNDDHDYFTVKGDEKKTLSDVANWVAFRTHYFNSTLLADNGFSKVEVNATTKLTDSNIIAKNRTTMDLSLAGGNMQTIGLKWYMGPNDYRIMKSYKNGMDEMVPLGVGLFAFVKYINKWILIPIFFFLSSFISNYGIIIILITVFIRLILSFFTYKSYLSAAKMRVLKPEVDELRAKYADDQQKFGMEQMKLFRTAGVNPLGGCLPTLFQIPILFAMYYLFPSFIEFRQQPFLWAHDLSTYDSIASWSTNIPVLSSVYGNHISLFTLLMTASSLFLALYNRNMTAQDPNNPMMKYMPFIFPIVLMGVFNKMAAALTCYYFFSNMLSIIQQFIIQKYIIDEKKIHAQIQENKNKPATPSKWQQRIEEMQKNQASRINQPPIKKK